MAIQFDQGISLCPLSLNIQRQFQLLTPSHIKSLVYTSSKDKIAAIAPLVIQEARDGNDDAHEIMMQAGKELARITVNVYNKLNFKHSTPIAVSGSILRLVPEIFAVFKKWCEESMKEITLVSQAEMAVKGTYYLMRDIYFKNRYENFCMICKNMMLKCIKGCMLKRTIYVVIEYCICIPM